MIVTARLAGLVVAFAANGLPVKVWVRFESVTVAGAGVTVRTAASLATPLELALLKATRRNWAPEFATTAPAALTVKADVVTPLKVTLFVRLLKASAPGTLLCHWNVIGVLPVTVAVKVAAWPEAFEALTGETRKDGVTDSPAARATEGEAPRRASRETIGTAAAAALRNRKGEANFEGRGSMGRRAER